MFPTKVSQMMESELPFDEEDDHYPEGKLPLLSAVEEQSSDSEEVVVFEKSDSIPNTTAVAINEPDDEMVTVNLSDGEPGKYYQLYVRKIIFILK